MFCLGILVGITSTIASLLVFIGPAVEDAIGLPSVSARCCDKLLVKC